MGIPASKEGKYTSKKTSKMIEAELKRQKEKDAKVVKLLLLGKAPFILHHMT